MCQMKRRIHCIHWWYMGRNKRKMDALCSKENMRVIKGVVRLVVVGHIVHNYRLRFIKEVVPCWWLVVLSAITVYDLSKNWFPFGGLLYCRPLLFRVDQRSGSLLVISCIVGHYFLRFIEWVVHTVVKCSWFYCQSLLFIFCLSNMIQSIIIYGLIWCNGWRLIILSSTINICIKCCQ